MKNYQEELQELLNNYRKTSLAPTSTLVENCTDLSAKLLQEINQLLPPDSYLSKSWLIAQKELFDNSLSNDQSAFINKAFLFWDKHKGLYEAIKKDSTFANIKKFGLANCGELASSVLYEQEHNPLLKEKLKNVRFFPAKIGLKYSPKSSKSDILKDKNSTEPVILTHVFLLYEEGQNTLENIARNLINPSSKTQALDIWKRKAGNAREMITEHIRQIGENGWLVIKSADEQRHFNLVCNKENQELSIIPTPKEPAKFLKGIHSNSRL